jgi:hypothetical protein
LNKTSSTNLPSQDEKIELQVEKWDVFARITPTVFLIISIILISTGYISFDTAFYLGLGLFAVTAVTWWFWTIYTIRHLIRTLNRASRSLNEVRDEFKDVKLKVEAFHNEQQP